MPFASGLPFPIVLTILPLRSLPWPVAVQATHKPPGQPVQIAPLLVDDEQSSAVPYVQSAPGSLVSAFLVTSLSPVCGFDVFTTPRPQLIWSTREQRPPRMFTKKVGTMKPGWLQHPCVPRGTQTLCSQVGKLSAAATVKTVWTPVGKGMTWPSAVTHGSWRHAPAVPP